MAFSDLGSLVSSQPVTVSGFFLRLVALTLLEGADECISLLDLLPLHDLGKGLPSE